MNAAQLCKALLDHWELALYKYCILLLLLLSFAPLDMAFFHNDVNESLDNGAILTCASK